MKSFFDSIKSVHFVGIGGISMSALAKYCLCKGIKVSGSDNNCSDNVKEIISLGGDLSVPFYDIKKLKCDLVVYSSAISENNKELMFAKRINIPILKRSEFLGKIIEEFSHSICVCGCHGKTTVTAMITHIFMRSKTIPTSFIGGIDRDFKNFFYGENELVILEGCEYKRNFLDLKPETVVVTNIDLDHPDSYNSLDDTIKTFKRFVENKRVIINSDDINCSSLISNAYMTYGIERGFLRATNIVQNENGSKFDIELNKQKLGSIEISLFGKFNIYNALASICSGIVYGIDFETIKDALKDFKGVKRRQELIGKLYNVNVYCDYAHHPKEIKSTIEAFNDSDSIVVFQPHTYSRTKALMSEFIDSLKNAKKVIIYKTYPSREDFDILGDGKTLYKLLKKKRKFVCYCKKISKLRRKTLKKSKGVKRIIFFGAGNIYEIAKSYIKNV